MHLRLRSLRRNEAMPRGNEMCLVQVEIQCVYQTVVLLSECFPLDKLLIILNSRNSRTPITTTTTTKVQKKINLIKAKQTKTNKQKQKKKTPQKQKNGFNHKLWNITTQINSIWTPRGSNIVSFWNSMGHALRSWCSSGEGYFQLASGQKLYLIPRGPKMSIVAVMKFTGW